MNKQKFAWLVLILILITACKNQPKTVIPEWITYDESEMLDSLTDHKNPRLRLKLIQSLIQDKNKIWKTVSDDISDFDEAEYERLKPLIYDQDILNIQASIEANSLTYEALTKWYLYRIVKYENNSLTTLHTIIALNPNAVEEARKRDREKGSKAHQIYGMPILLKDNINTEGMLTTAGAVALKDNATEDAHIVKRLKENGAIILGKVNLSEWAYFFCGGCPVGYSAIGGQTLNPYGRGIFETGGSSAGSGTSMAANYAAAAVGTETSGSILSPSGKNSIVGLKPTIGWLSRSGIVPISGTLDTPGPMTRSVSDNAIMLSAMQGEDPDDSFTLNHNRPKDYLSSLDPEALIGARLGAISSFIERDSNYRVTIEKLRELGAEIIVYDAPEVSLEGFSTLLSAEMKRDLPIYLEKFGGDNNPVNSVDDVVKFNLQDTLIRAPYGQVRLEGSANDTTSQDSLQSLWLHLSRSGKEYFEIPIKEHNLDAVLSKDNFSAGFAAVAHYPCLTVPMGYEEDGEPTNLTFIAPSGSEAKLLQLGYSFEQLTNIRKSPF